MHPWERDARWAHHVLHKAHPFTVLVEIACTRSSEELLGARKAYHALFHHSLEEDVAYRVKESNAKVSIASSFRQSIIYAVWINIELFIFFAFKHSES